MVCKLMKGETKTNAVKILKKLWQEKDKHNHKGKTKFREAEVKHMMQDLQRRWYVLGNACRSI